MMDIRIPRRQFDWTIEFLQHAKECEGCMGIILSNPKHFERVKTYTKTIQQTYDKQDQQLNE